MMRIDKYIKDILNITKTQAKSLIQNGRITANSLVIKDSGYQVKGSDVIMYDSTILHYETELYYMLNKPKGVITATEDSRMATVMDLLSVPQKDSLFPVGRLDIDTTGLLLITNNGILSHSLLSPNKHVAKVYRFVIAQGSNPLPLDQVASMFENGIVIYDPEPYKTASAKLEMIDETTGLVTITEGKFHQVKKMWIACGYLVVELERVAFGPLTLGNLPVGEFRRLSESEIDELKKASSK